MTVIGLCLRRACRCFFITNCLILAIPVCAMVDLFVMAGLWLGVSLRDCRVGAWLVTIAICSLTTLYFLGWSTTCISELYSSVFALLYRSIAYVQMLMQICSSCIVLARTLSADVTEFLSFVLVYPKSACYFSTFLISAIWA